MAYKSVRFAWLNLFVLIIRRYVKLPRPAALLFYKIKLLTQFILHTILQRLATPKKAKTFWPEPNIRYTIIFTSINFSQTSRQLAAKA